MNIKRVGIELVKQVFQLHGVDSQEKTVLRQQLRRVQLLDCFKKPPALLDGYGSLQHIGRNTRCYCALWFCYGSVQVPVPPSRT